MPRDLLLPAGKGENGLEIQDKEKEVAEKDNDENISVKKSKSAWSYLIAKIYEIDPLVCLKCGSEMKVLSIITDAYEINKILKHLIKINEAPP